MNFTETVSKNRGKHFYIKTNPWQKQKKIANKSIFGLSEHILTPINIAMV